MWIKDAGDKDLKGSVDVQGREGSIEVIAFEHYLSIPTDANSGKLTGTRIHAPIKITKETDASTPYLYEAVATGKTMNSVEIKWYRTDHDGKEKEYFNTLLTTVKIVGVAQKMLNIKDPAFEHRNHFDEIELRYETIKWSYLDGNIIARDSWNERP
jgi:type VI secretion system secreted protein Hcp